MNKKFLRISMATLFAMLLFSCQEKREDIEENKDSIESNDSTLTEQIITPKVIDYAPGYSQFIGERFLNCESKADILEQCTQILSTESGDITLGGFGGYLTIDLGSEPRVQDYTFRFNGNGFDDNYCLVSVSNDATTWQAINADEVPMVELSYVQNTSHNTYTWQIDSVTTCRTIGVREICNTKVTYNWDTTAIWSKIINGVEQKIVPHSNGAPLLYIRAHQGPYFNPHLSTPSGLVPQMNHTLRDSFRVEKSVRYIKFQNVCDSISPIVGEISPEINNITVLFQ